MSTTVCMCVFTSFYLVVAYRWVAILLLSCLCYSQNVTTSISSLSKALQALTVLYGNLYFLTSLLREPFFNFLLCPLVVHSSCTTKSFVILVNSFYQSKHCNQISSYSSLFQEPQCCPHKGGLSDFEPFLWQPTGSFLAF